MVSWLKQKKGDSSDIDDDITETSLSGATFDLASQLKSQRVTLIKKMQLNTINDIQAIQGEISEGNMTIIDVAGFITSGEFTVLELKRAIEQIKVSCKKLGGAIARLGDRYLVATPNPSLQLMV